RNVVEMLESRMLLSVSFASTVATSVNFSGSQLQSADFNGDGKQDLVFPNANLDVGDATNTSTSIALSNGDGTFTVVAGPTFPAYPACFAPFPLDGNARTDLVFASQNATGQGVITFEKNTSVGNDISFAALHTTAITTTATSFQPTQILVGDFHDNQSSGTSTAHLDLAVLGTD